MKKIEEERDLTTNSQRRPQASEHGDHLHTSLVPRTESSGSQSTLGPSKAFEVWPWILGTEAPKLQRCGGVRLRQGGF